MLEKRALSIEMSCRLDRSLAEGNSFWYFVHMLGECVVNSKDRCQGFAVAGLSS